jgi:hypothetical protein
MSEFEAMKPGDIRPDFMQQRDLVGYGATSPDPCWPNGAKIAVSISLNIEGGGEATLANGDGVSEGMLNDIGVPTKAGVRVPLVESVFDMQPPRRLAGARRARPFQGAGEYPGRCTRDGAKSRAGTRLRGTRS